MLTEYSKDRAYMQELKDIKRSGKERDWNARKRMSIPLSESYARLGMDSKSDRVFLCGSFLEFKRYIASRELRLHTANFCRVRLCPMCAARRSEKIYGQVSKIMTHIEQSENYRYLFLTLTVRNVPEGELIKTIDAMFYGLKKLVLRKEMKSIAKGWFRGFEVTHNWKTDKYHPHIHMIIAVEPKYFKRGYMQHKEWKNLWQNCMDLDYDPYVDIRTVKPRLEEGEGEGMSYKGAVSEIAKYTAKPSDYIKERDIDRTDRAVSTMDYALANRRLMAFGGEMKRVHKLLSLTDPVEGDLTNIDGDEELRADLAYVIEKYHFDYGAGLYMLKEVSNERSRNSDEISKE